MESRAKLFGHPIHQMLIVFPLGLLATAVIFDGIGLATGDEKWSDMAFYMIVAGVLSGLIAALFGWIDWIAIPSGTRAKSVGLTHGLGNVVVTGLFIASGFLRRDAPNSPETPALALSFAGAGLAMVTGWLGGELVNRLGVGVHDGAHLDSPNSLSGRPASEGATPGGGVTR